MLEWLGILYYTRQRTWSTDDRRMMAAATKRHLSRAGAALALAAFLTLAGYFVRENERTSDVLERARNADFGQFSSLLPEIDDRRDALRGPLERIEAAEPAASRNHKVAELLLYRDKPTPERASALLASLPSAGTDELSLIRDTLALHPAEAGAAQLRQTLFDESAAPGDRLRAACVLSVVEPVSDATWDKLSASLTQALLAEDRHSVSRWIDMLGPAVRALIPELGRACRDSSADSSTRSAAAEALTEALVRRPDPLLLAQLVVESQPDASRILLRQLTKLTERGQSRSYLHGVLTEKGNGPAKDHVARRQAAACIALAALGDADVIWPRLRHSDDPCLRSFLIQDLSRADFLRQALIDRLQGAEVDPIERQAILLAWAETKLAGIPSANRARVVDLAQKLYLDDPAAGVHSAAELLLRRWAEADLLAQCDRQLRQPDKGPAGKDWALGPTGTRLQSCAGRFGFEWARPKKRKGVRARSKTPTCARSIARLPSRQPK